MWDGTFPTRPTALHSSMEAVANSSGATQNIPGLTIYGPSDFLALRFRRMK